MRGITSVVVCLGQTVTDYLQTSPSEAIQNCAGSGSSRKSWAGRSTSSVGFKSERPIFEPELGSVNLSKKERVSNKILKLWMKKNYATTGGKAMGFAGMDHP